MFASITDYAAVYDQAYRASRGDHTSSDAAVLPSLVMSFCCASGCGALLDVSGGQGRLRTLAEEAGLRALATDLVADPERGVLALDLAGFDGAAVGRLREAAARHFAGTRHLTTCFDVLEHVDREHLAAALRSLWELADRIVVASVSTRPSSRDNRFHATILPWPTWLRLLELAGFAVVADAAGHFAPATRCLPGGGDPLVDHWRAVDPFGDVAEGEPRYLVLEKLPGARDWAAAAAEMEGLLDLRHRRDKRARFAPAAGQRIALNLHYAQEYPHFRALLDVLPRRDLMLLVRDGFMPEVQRRAILGLFARNGVETHLYQRAEELPWAAIAGRCLITAAESGVATGHALSQQVVGLARLHGCRTVLLQHGIWPAAFPGRIAAFASEHVVTWGSGDARALAGNLRPLLGASAPWGTLPPAQEKRIGSPRYADQLMPVHGDGLAAWLGVARGGYNRVVLLATKDLRGRLDKPNLDAGLLASLGRAVEAHPETLFLLRPHPANSALDLLALRRPNLRFLDETCGITADLQMCRILPLVDVVVTTPSTLVLDAAVSGKATIVYGPGQRAPYGHFEAVDPDRIATVIGDDAVLADAVHRAGSFREANAEAVDGPFYERFAALLATPPQPAQEYPGAALAATVSLGAEIEARWCEAERLRAEAGQAAVALGEARGALEATGTLLRQATDALAGAGASLAAVRQEAAEDAALAQAARHQLAALTASTSWRRTAPLRRAVDAVRHLTRRNVT